MRGSPLTEAHQEGLPGSNEPGKPASRRRPRVKTKLGVEYGVLPETPTPGSHRSASRQLADALAGKEHPRNLHSGMRAEPAEQ